MMCIGMSKKCTDLLADLIYLCFPLDVKEIDPYAETLTAAFECLKYSSCLSEKLEEVIENDIVLKY